jgi:diguanylate cyclase (GGDEF)-like protein
MLWSLLTTNTFYVCALSLPSPHWLLTATAILMGAGPLAVSLIYIRSFTHYLRWSTVVLYAALSVFLLLMQRGAGDGGDLEINAVLFTVYFGCCIHFGYRYRSATAGTCITIAGFLAWAAVFVVSPILGVHFPNVHIESEVWNLPKYVVAVGMILLLLEEQIEHNKHLALHDPLTGLPNRRLFEDRLINVLERARRTEVQAALLMLDLNDFKKVNDTLGHHVGDLLLARVAALFNTRVRRSDTVARTGGDEFSVVLEGPMNMAAAQAVGQSLLEMLKDPMDLEGHTVRIGASLGVAIFPDDAESIEALCVVADVRMYDDKRCNASRAAENILPVTPERPKERSSMSKVKTAQ